MQNIQYFNKQKIRLFYRLWFLVFIFLGTKNFVFAGEYTCPRLKAIFGPLQYFKQISDARGYDNFNRFLPCGGIMIYLPKIDYLYLEIGVDNYKNFNFINNVNLDGINITEEIVGKIKAIFHSLLGLITLFTNKNGAMKSGGKEYTKVFFARLGFSFNSPINYLINDPLNASKIDILIEFPVRYNKQWFNVEGKNYYTLNGEKQCSNYYYKNINIIIVPIRFINRSFSTRVSLLKINLKDIDDIISKLKAGKDRGQKIMKNIFYLVLKGFSIELVFNFGSIADTILSKI